MKTTLTMLLLALGAVLCSALNDPDPILFRVPAHFPAPVYRFTNNTVTEAGFRLGRVLFYDPLLSKDSSISCANCHQPFAAFANTDHAVSHGVDGCLGNRNAPALFNLAWQKEFMWDGGVNHIELSPLNALTSACEMAASLDTITARLRRSELYPGLFRSAFGSDTINTQRMLRALTQFTAMLVSAGSKYDKHVNNEPGGSFDADEEAGYSLFRQHCNTCHTEPLFTDLSYRSNGLDVRSEDPGRDSITGQETDRGRFRVPSLRNIELTAPYMHDGRFNSLNQVLHHYTAGMQNPVNLDTSLSRNGTPGIRLTALEQKQMVIFLKTLTDRDFIHDKRFQNPD